MEKYLNDFFPSVFWGRKQKNRMNDKLRINNEITNHNSKRGKDPSMEANHKHGRNV